MNTSLDNATKFFARNCECRPISSDEARDFMDQHHRQGSTKDKTVSCGIYSPGGDLLGVISFCSPRTAAKRREYSRELVRLCFKSGVRVVGGASKLFKFYTKTYSPADIFTYQDATGEVTDVYEKSGMKFVSQGKRKSYLVAPGKTLDTGSRREVLGLAYAVRYGPDRILGTKVGEVFDPQTGKRKSNRDIFLENLGWHIEDTNGDRVYEWINPSMTHYVYKITASDSKKYYYGVSHVKKADATVDDCLADDYWGSGGSLSSNKFNNWKKKHKDTLQKEILRRFKRKSEAYNFEKSIIGDLYATDKLCLNSIMGGKDGGVNGWKESSPLNESICEIHGKTFFIGIKCRKCISANSFTKLVCPKHGDGFHNGESCMRCVSDAKNSVGICEIHGSTPFQGMKCYKCIMSERTSIKVCEIHGSTKFSGSSCIKCYTAPNEKVCKIHGTTPHTGDSCMKCRAESAKSVRTCEIHGKVNFKGDSCYKCWGEKSTSISECEKHGQTKFRKGTCCKCKFESNIKLQECPFHGESKHIKGICYKCRGEAAYHKTNHEKTNNPSNKCRLCEKDRK